MIEVKPIYWYKLAPLGDRIVTRIDPRGQPNEKEFSPLYDQSTIDALQARIAELEKDAGRYRVLREDPHWSVINKAGHRLQTDLLDALIDAAIAPVNLHEYANEAIDVAIKENSNVDG